MANIKTCREHDCPQSSAHACTRGLDICQADTGHWKREFSAIARKSEALSDFRGVLALLIITQRIVGSIARIT
jgi:hypothetical protein